MECHQLPNIHFELMYKQVNMYANLVKRLYSIYQTRVKYFYFQISAMFCGQLCFLLRVPAEGSSIGCHTVSVLTHYTLIASYFWSFLLAVEIIRTIQSMHAVNQKSRKKFLRLELLCSITENCPLLSALHSLQSLKLIYLSFFMSR